MCPLSLPARIRIRNKYLVEKRVENPIDGVVYEPVAHACLVDVAGLGVGYFEVVIGAVAVGAIC